MPIICNQLKPIYDKQAITTAYTLSEDETDSSPFIGAWGDDLRQATGCIVATRLYPKNTILDIKGYGRCVVLDKTGKRFADRLDLLFPTKQEALKFGKKILQYRAIN